VWTLLIELSNPGTFFNENQMDYETNTSTSTINTTTTNTAEINNNIIEPNKQPDTM